MYQEILFMGAVYYGHKPMVSWLLSQSINPAVNDNYCLITASQNGDLDLLHLLLLDSRVDPTAQDHMAIKLAASRDHLKCVELLMMHPQIQVDIQKYLKGYADMYHLTLMLRFNLDNHTLYHYLIFLVKQSRLDEVKYLIQTHHMDPSLYNDILIRSACQVGLYKLVSFLLNYPTVNPCVKQQSPLLLACWSGHFEIVVLLLSDKRIDPSLNDCKALKVAARRGFNTIVKELLSNNRGYYGFHDSVSRDPQAWMSFFKQLKGIST